MVQETNFDILIEEYRIHRNLVKTNVKENDRVINVIKVCYKAMGDSYQLFNSPEFLLFVNQKESWKKENSKRGAINNCSSFVSWLKKEKKIVLKNNKLHSEMVQSNARITTALKVKQQEDSVPDNSKYEEIIYALPEENLKDLEDKCMLVLHFLHQPLRCDTIHIKKRNYEQGTGCYFKFNDGEVVYNTVNKVKILEPITQELDQYQHELFKKLARIDNRSDYLFPFLGNQERSGEYFGTRFTRLTEKIFGEKINICMARQIKVSNDAHRKPTFEFLVALTENCRLSAHSLEETIKTYLRKVRVEE
jgi:hypothetical protein